MKEFKTRDKILKVCVYATVSVCFILLFYRIIADLSGVYAAITTILSFLISVVKPVLIGLVLAYILHRAVEHVEEWILRRNIFKGDPIKKQNKAHGWGVVITVLGAVLIVCLLLAVMVPTVVDSVMAIADEAPTYVKIAQKFFNDLSSSGIFQRAFRLLGIDFSNTEQINGIVTDVVAAAEGWLKNFAGGILPALSNMGSAVVNFFLGIVFAIYILVNQDELVCQCGRFFKAVLPEKTYAFFAKVGYNMDDLFFKYLSGKLFTSALLGIFCGVACLCFGVNHAFPIGVILAISNMIPVVGPWLGAVPSVLLAVLSGWVEALIVVGIILVAQQVESNILEPKIQGDNIGINSFWVLFGIIVFGNLFGVVGMVLALPVCGVIRILICEWLEKREAAKEKKPSLWP